MSVYRFLPFVLLLISLNSFCQELLSSEKLPHGTYPGYIVKINHDTLFGEIIVQNSYYKLCNEVEFIDRNNQKIIYYPYDLLAFHFGKTHFVGNTWVFTKDYPYYGLAFVQQLVDGYINYYRYLFHEVKTIDSHVSVPKLSEDFYYAYGSLKPNVINFFKELGYITWDHHETYEKIYNRQFVKENMPEILYHYNCWLSQSGKIVEKNQSDSIFASTKLDLEAAYNNSLLAISKNDKNFYEYFHRILYYISNTEKFKGYTIYENKDDFGRTLLCGLKVNVNDKYIKVGTWRYYHENEDSKGDLQLKMEESYDYNGKLQGIVTIYDKKGQIESAKTYQNGTKLKDHK